MYSIKVFTISLQIFSPKICEFSTAFNLSSEIYQDFQYWNYQIVPEDLMMLL